jgi:hypothetical protein
MNIKHNPDWVCPDCGDPKRGYYAKGLCSVCYARARRRRLGVKEHGHWNKHDSCTVCGAKPIKARGMCQLCYGRYLEKKNKARRILQKRFAGERHRFGGGLKEILASSDYKCENCGLTDAESMRKWNRHLDIHHIDGNGRTASFPNHSKSNLMVLCRVCHMAIHHPRGRRIDQCA